MSASPSIAGRAVLALALMIGFYVLALTIAGALLYVPYGMWVVTNHHINARIAVGSLIGGLTILWAVLPRIDRFEAPGPLLQRKAHPRLFAELESIAAATHQEMPVDVYLVGDVNAWVSQRGGVMGFGSKRVMGLGLPLMRTLSRTQMRAVVAHEFGHFYGGDTRLGPWIYKTRGAIFRTLQSLSGEGAKQLLQMPFRAYAMLFLRVTHAVSRRQELVADELAARTVGPQHLIEGLRTVHAVGPAMESYWRGECLPVLGSGFLPPIAEGFAQFIRAEPVAKALQEQLEAELKTHKSNPFDTHPPLKERIDAIQDMPRGSEKQDDARALSLLEGVAGLERELIETLAGKARAKRLVPLRWDEVVERVYMPDWRKLVELNAKPLSELTPESLPALARDIGPFRVRVVTIEGISPGSDPGKQKNLSVGVLSAALAVLLADRGARIDAPPGEMVKATIGACTVEPFVVLGLLGQKKLSEEEWRAQCEQLGIAGLPLAKIPSPA